MSYDIPKRNHQKPFADPEHSSYFPDINYQINCPAQLRITPYGGAQKIYYQRAWQKSQRFWCVIDIRFNQIYYLPTIEARVRMGLFGKDWDNIRLSQLAKKEVIYKKRYLVEEIDFKVFLDKTGRDTDWVWDYATEKELRKCILKPKLPL